jgi:nucleotide-binding universal stress UspA family protein
MYTKILMPVVDTPLCERSGRFGLEFARLLGARVVVFHASANKNSAAAKDLLLRWKYPEGGVDGGVPLETLLSESNDAARAIVEAAEAQGCDLIVMGTHARGGLPRLLLGSVAERVLQTTPLPLMLLREHADIPQEARLEHLLVPLEGSPVDMLAISAAGDLAQRLGARVTLLYVLQAPALPSADFIGTAGYAMTNWDAEYAAVKRSGEAALETARLEFTALHPTLEVGTRLFEGGQRDVGDVIVDVAREGSANLIVMGTHARRGLDRFILGSVAERVAHHADAPVLILRTLTARETATARVPITTELRTEGAAITLQGS